MRWGRPQWRVPTLPLTCFRRGKVIAIALAASIPEVCAIPHARVIVEAHDPVVAGTVVPVLGADVSRGHTSMGRGGGWLMDGEGNKNNNTVN